MIKLLEKYSEKLVRHGLCKDGEPIVGGMNDKIIWNRNTEENHVLEEVMNGMNINSIMYAVPEEPFGTILKYFADKYEVISPEDTETRTFLHDIPICSFQSDEILENLKKRKAVITRQGGIVTYGTVSPEQAFVVFSSICFSTFVKFFTDYAYSVWNGKIDKEYSELIKKSIDSYLHFFNRELELPELGRGAFDSDSVYAEMVKAGRATVEYRMVDSFFGNISYFDGKTIYISQTGSSMDELEGCIDPCPIDGSKTSGITASSELVAHTSVYNNTYNRAILHGHPRFSVIMSMLCREECEHRGRCHVDCTKERFIEDIPIVPGEVGTGEKGLCNTMPPALKGKRGAIVYGHGVFTGGKIDFNEAFGSLYEIENMCFNKYLELIKY